MDTYRPLRLPLYAALIAAVAAVAGSLYLSMGLGLVACPICGYQRGFAMAVLVILVLGLTTKARDSGFVNLFAFVPTVIGGMIAAYHSFSHLSGLQICPKGLFGIGHTPEQSVVSFVLILGCLLPGLAYDIVHQRIKIAAVLWSFLLGAMLAYLCIAASPGVPTPSKPTELECYAPIKDAPPTVRMVE